MARIAGVTLPKNKRVEVALTYIFGIGNATSKNILRKCQVDPNKRTDVLTEAEIAGIRQVIEREHKVEGDLRRDITINIKRLVDLNTYRGIRHRKGLPVRGQKTHSNARTRKGPRKTVAGKKSVKQLK